LTLDGSFAEELTKDCVSTLNGLKRSRKLKLCSVWHAGGIASEDETDWCMMVI